MAIITAAFYQEFFRHEQPCPLCYLQRVAMIGVSMGALLNLRFGVKVQHYALSLIFAFFGGFVALRQICLHICPGFPVFGYPVLGFNLYTWSFLSFAAVFFAIIILLFFYSKVDCKIQELNWLDVIAVVCIFSVIVCNLVAVGYQCQFGPCKDVPWPQKQVGNCENCLNYSTLKR